MEIGCADDVAAVVLLLGNDGQHGHHLALALHAWFVHLLGFVSVPCELRRVGWAAVADGTGEGVWLILHCLVENAHQRFIGIIYGFEGQGQQANVEFEEYEGVGNDRSRKL